LIEKCDNGISFSKFKMATVAMLNSDNQAFFGATDEFLFQVATILPNLMKFGQQMKERHQFF